MNLRENLTKENFFNEAMEKYPKATKLFCEWIDEYKKAVGWQKLFNITFNQSHIKMAGNSEIYSIAFSPPNFHQLPYEMQQGIWIKFANETLNVFFEQSEYTYSGDLEEDIKTVFAEINELIDTEEGFAKKKKCVHEWFRNTNPAELPYQCLICGEARFRI